MGELPETPEERAATMRELAGTLEGPRETGTVLAILDANARASERLANQIQEGLEAEVRMWRKRAEQAERTIERMESNVLRMLHANHGADFSWQDD